MTAQPSDAQHAPKVHQSAVSGGFKRWLRRYGLLVAFAVLQFGYWAQTKDIKPNLAIVPNVPGKQALQALTFGDNEFYFRVLAFQLQNAGDTFGRFTALRYYDFNKLYHWFMLLDELDSTSNMIPGMATYYFSQTQNTADVRYIVDYLYTHSMKNIAHKWWWLLQSIYLASYKLNDMDLALKVATPLVDERVPVWAQQMTAVVHEKRGEMEDALRIMETIRANAKEIPDADLRYMTYFVKERLEKLDEATQEHEGAQKSKPPQATEEATSLPADRE